MTNKEPLSYGEAVEKMSPLAQEAAAFFTPPKGHECSEERKAEMLEKLGYVIKPRLTYCSSCDQSENLRQICHSCGWHE